MLLCFGKQNHVPVLNGLKNQNMYHTSYVFVFISSDIGYKTDTMK